MKAVIAKYYRLLNQNTMKFEINTKAYEAIAKVIHSDDSPVGIDAKKTHILILHQLQLLNDRMERIEEQLMKK